MPAIYLARKILRSYASPAVVVLLLFQLLPSCKKEEQTSLFPQPKDSVEMINRWILDSMYYYYLYNDQIDISGGLSGKPDVFFRKLINPDDPFSWISNETDYPQPKTSFDHYGFHYVIVQLPEYSASQLLGIVTAVAPESPASRAGLERGAYFSKVNGTTIDASNLNNAVALLGGGKNIRLTMLEENNGDFDERGIAVFSASYFEERPVYVTKLLSHNGVKAGYIFYNRFEEFFDKDILDALSTFKNEHATELILDLRYNPGGSVATAAKITTALVKNIHGDQTFSIFKGNANMGTVVQAFDAAINSSGNTYKRSFESISGESLGLSRVFILSSPATTSAAEMMINNLKPYIQVIHIGETTRGKDKAGWVIRDQRQPKQVQWFIQPMVFKIFNASGKGDYKDGLKPDYEMKECSYLPLYPIGDINDPLINKAVALIFTGGTVDEQIMRKHHFRLEDRAVMYRSMGQGNGSVVELHKN